MDWENEQQPGYSHERKWDDSKPRTHEEMAENNRFSDEDVADSGLSHRERI